MLHVCVCHNDLIQKLARAAYVSHAIDATNASGTELERRTNRVGGRDMCHRGINNRGTRFNISSVRRYEKWKGK